MVNGASPHGPSYRAHPRLYHRDDRDTSLIGPESGNKRTRVKRKIDANDPNRSFTEQKWTTSGIWDFPSWVHATRAACDPRAPAVTTETTIVPCADTGKMRRSARLYLDPGCRPVSGS